MKPIGVAFALFLLLTPVLTTFAQAPDPRCLSLSDADCELFDRAMQNMAALTAFNNADFTLTLGGSGGASTGNNLSLAGSGPMLVADGQITAFDLVVSGGMNADDAQAGELIWQDDMFYTAAPDETGALSWRGTGLESANAELLTGVLSGNLLVSALSQPGVVILERLPDEEIDGQNMAVFVGNVDLTAFLLTPPILNTLTAALQVVPPDALGEEGAAIPPDFDLAGAIPFLSFLMTEDIFKVTQWVNLEDELVYRVQLEIKIELDATMVQPEAGVVGFDFALSTDLDQHGATFAITPPAEYQEGMSFDLSGLSLESFMGGAGTAPEEQTFEAEGVISYGETVRGTLSRSNPEDVWGFSAQAGDTIRVIMKASTTDSSLDTQIYLRDSSGVQLYFNDDHGTARTDLGIFDSLIDTVTLEVGGEYLIVASWLTETVDGDYELTLERAD